MLASRTSRWSMATVLLCVVLLAASWFLLVSPRRADAESVRQEVASQKGQLGVLQQELADLKTQYTALPKKKADLKAIKEQLPPDADVAALVRNLQEFATATGVSLDSVTPGTPTVITDSAVTGAVTTAKVGSVISVPLQITITGQYFENSLYVKDLQTQMTRSMLISGISTTPAASSEVSATPVPAVTPTPAATASPSAAKDLTMTIASSVFVLLDGTSTVEDVVKEAKTAALGSQSSTSSAATSGTGTTTTR